MSLDVESKTLSMDEFISQLAGRVDGRRHADAPATAAAIGMELSAVLFPGAGRFVVFSPLLAGPFGFLFLFLRELFLSLFVRIIRFGHEFPSLNE